MVLEVVCIFSLVLWKTVVCWSVMKTWTRGPFQLVCTYIIWATSWENLFMSYANNKDADQPAYPLSLISVFVIRCLDSIKLPFFYIRNLKPLANLCGCAARDQFDSYLDANPEDRFSRDDGYVKKGLFLRQFLYIPDIWYTVKKRYFLGMIKTICTTILLYYRQNSLTHICLVDPSILINWTSPFPILGVSGVLFHFYSTLYFE